MTLFPAPTTNLDSLHDLVAQLEAVSQRWLDDARVKPEPPNTTDISNISISVRRITLIHRDIYKLENPGLAFPSAKKSSPTHTHTQADEPSSAHDASASSFRNSPFAIRNSSDPEILSKNPSSTTTHTYSREISRYVAACIVKSIKSKPEDAADCCPDLYEEMDLMKSNPAYHAKTLTDFHSPNATPKKSFSENSVIAMAPCENSSDPVDPPNPCVLSKSSEIAVHANPYLLNPNADDDYDPNDDLDDPELTSDFSDPVNPPNPDILSNNSSSMSDFSNSPFAIRNLSDPVILSKNSSSASSIRNSPFAIRHSPPRPSISPLRTQAASRLIASSECTERSNRERPPP